MFRILNRLAFLLLLLGLSACDEHAWNDPYPNQAATSNTLYTAFVEQPKHLDPALCYDTNCSQFVAQIYEPILEYSYLLRPYQLQPLIAANMPQISYDAKTNITTYKINIKSGVMYQPHPAFAKDEQGNYQYHNLSFKQASSYSDIKQFKHTGTRELKAADYVYQIKRLADPTLNSPILGFLGPYIVGLVDFHKLLSQEYAANPNQNSLDLRNYQFAGANIIDDYNYEIKINGKYAQFIYWLAMSFFAPVPWEATAFYGQPGMSNHNISLDTYPIGTGAYLLTENNPARRILLQRNPNFHADFYPTVGMPGDAEKGYLNNAGKKMPFIDAVVFSLEKESVPYWDKFVQGYYDRSGLSEDNFNTAISISNNTTISLAQSLLDKGIRLRISDTLSVSYWGFNMLDEVVGGYSDRARNLRQAISLAFDVDEFNVIFFNDRGILADGPIPPGIFGYQTPPPYDYPARLSLAKKYLAAAGYADGIDKKTGKQLQIFFDAISSGDPDEKSIYGWIQKQFEKLGINLIIRATDYNRFSDKMRAGTAQLFSFGWLGDYPDPENFLFLFYGPNATVHDGTNSTNYNNPKFNELFEKFKAMGTDPRRITLINEMVAMLQADAPWIWGLFPQSFGLFNPWYAATKPNTVAMNSLKYLEIDPKMRTNLRLERNKPLVWPIFIVVTVLIIIITPAVIGYIKRGRSKAERVR